jgi:serine/threonine protein kinase
MCLLGFPAVKGTLEDLIRSPDMLKINPGTLARWTLAQCLRLSDAVMAIYEGETSSLPQTQGMGKHGGEAMYCIHSDIKPSNILWFGPPSPPPIGSPGPGWGTLQFAGFGISKFHPDETKSSNPFGAKTKTYAAPESETRQGLMSGVLDIWSLGCVFLELLSYLVMRKETFADEFSEARSAVVRELGGSLAIDTFYALKPDAISDKETRTDGEIQRLCLNEAVRNVSYIPPSLQLTT